MQLPFLRSVRFALWAALAAPCAVACGKPEPVAPRAPVAPPPPPSEPPGVLPLAPVPPILVQAVGFQSPESVLYDPTTDLYLVSNIQGDPLERDGNGFISRITPEGALAELKWIDGTTTGVELDAPKGMVIVGDKLYVADIDTVRSFDRQSGKPLGDIAVPSATFLNDLTAAPDGTLFVSDTGFRKFPGVADLQKSGGDAIYAIDVQGGVSVLVKGPELGQPNGLLADDQGVWVASLDGEVYRVSRAGQRTAVATLPGGGLDGLVRTASGRLIVSSWQTSTVYAGKAAAPAPIAPAAAAPSPAAAPSAAPASSAPSGSPASGNLNIAGRASGGTGPAAAASSGVGPATKAEPAAPPSAPPPPAAPLTPADAVESFDPLITELDAPADLGYDPKRRQLIVPLFKQNAIYMQQVTAD